MMRLWVCLLSSVMALGCAARKDWDWAAQYSAIPRASQNPAPERTLADWDSLEQLKPGSRVAVYLENGGKMIQKFQGFDPERVVLDIDGVPREKIVAVAEAPEDKPLNGVLIGIGSGVGVGLGSAAAFHAEEGGDFGPIAAWLSIYGVMGGAGSGALLDAGMATPEKPVFMRGNSGPAREWKRWTLHVPALQVLGWVSGRKVELMLQDGTYVQGKVVGGKNGTLRVDVDDSSRKDYEDRILEFTADQLGAITYRERTGGNRASAGFGGGIAGFFIGGALGMPFSDAADETGIVLGFGGGSILGTLIGLGLAEHYGAREITLVATGP